MGFDLDPFDDIFADGAATNARAGGKFQPRAKFRPRKESSASVPSSRSEQAIAIAEHTSTESIRTEKPSELVIPSPEHVATRESNGDWHSCPGKSEEEVENTDIFIGLESLDDVRSQSTSIKGRSLPHSEATTVHVSDTRNTKGRNDIPVVSPVDDLADELPVSLDPLTRGEATISSNDREFHIENRRVETEEAETFPCLETLDIMSESTTRSGPRTGNFHPMTKAQIHKEKNNATIPNLEAGESVCCPDDAQWAPPTEYMNEESIPAFPSNDVLDFSSMGFSDSIPTDPTSEELMVNKEPINLTGNSHSDPAISGGHPEAVPEMPEVEAGRSLRQRRKRINACELIDESEDDGPDDGEYPAECPSGNDINEDNNNNNDEEYQVENESQDKRVRRKSRKAVAEKQKPIRKRKKANDVSDQSTKAPSKKFSHSTRRNRRQVDKALLETPDHEIDFQKLPIRDLIMLAEYKERTMNKEAATSEMPSFNQSSANSYAPHYNEDEAFGSEQNRDSQDEQGSPRVQESATYFNYQSHMEKTRTVRWSKQDTELFYEAVQQFGTDLSMIQQLFPGRTRRQVKLKYKKEERQQPLRLREALTNRSKDHSHFESVIERLQQIAAQEKQNSNRDRLTGEEAEEVTPENNEEEEVAKSEQQQQQQQEVEGGGVENMEAAIQSPVKSSDSEDDFYRWSQYKSEL